MYLDDILVLGQNVTDQIQNLRPLFQRLRQFNMKLNPKKCNFCKPKIQYLGYTLSAEGISTGQDKTKVIRETEMPTTLNKVQQFLGLCNYFRRMVNNYSSISKPLSDLTTKEAKYSKGLICWGGEKHQGPNLTRTLF